MFFVVVCESRLHRTLLPENIERGNKFYSSVSCLCVFNSLFIVRTFKFSSGHSTAWIEMIFYCTFFGRFTSTWRIPYLYNSFALNEIDLYFVMNGSKNDGAYTIDPIFNGSNNKIGKIIFFRSIFISLIASLHSCQIISFISESNIFRFNCSNINFFRDGIGTFSSSKRLSFGKRSALFDSHVDS